MTDTNNTPVRRSQEAIEALKKDWLGDPSWDIEDTEGFEAHRIELLAWRQQHEAEQAKKQAVLAGTQRLETLKKRQAQLTALEKMVVHDELPINEHTKVIRVPGGWIYKTVDKKEYDTNAYDAQGNRVWQLALSSSSVFVSEKDAQLLIERTRIASAITELEVELKSGKI